jgi:hypothetical protein
MDFSLNVADPSLQANFATSLEFLTQHDFDLYPQGLYFPPSMVYQTIEPSQLTDTSSQSSSPSSTFQSPSSSVPTSPNYTSDSSATGSLSQPRRTTKRRQPKSQAVNTVAAADSTDHQHIDEEHHVKRHQTKLACTWCRKLSKKCDAQRPCARCVQFDRCSECVDAPPRKPRAKGVDRGVYKKTRDLAVVDYQKAVNRREVYVAKQGKLGRSLKVGLSADEILEKTRKDEARMEKENQKEDRKLLLHLNGDVTAAVGKSNAAIQGGLLPFTGPLEDLFTCSASPEMEEVSFSSPSPANSPAESVFDIEVVSSPTSVSSVTDYDESDFNSWQWHTMEQFPSIMEIISAAQAAKASDAFDTEEYLRWSDAALAA